MRNRIAALLAALLAFLLLFSACAPQDVIDTLSEALSEAEILISEGEALPEEEPEPPEETEPPDSLQVETAAPEEPDAEDGSAALSADGVYTGKEEVALYLHLYEHLPGNFITKKKAQSLGWNGGSLEPYAPGKSIGGDRFGNREGLLPKKQGRVYYECDIGTMGKSSRGSKRIVWSNDGLIYYTDDHYESFERLY